VGPGSVEIQASVVLDQMNDPVNRLNLMILDACRTNPFSGHGKGGGRGLVVMDAPAGTIIAYATQPGAEAADGTGADSPYTTALAKALKQPGMDIFHLFNAVGLDVMRVTANSQQPAALGVAIADLGQLHVRARCPCGHRAAGRRRRTAACTNATKRRARRCPGGRTGRRSASS